MPGVHNNQLTGSIPVELGNLSSLRWLSLNNLEQDNQNQLTGYIPAELGNLSNLQELYLNNPAELGNLSNLEHLSLGDNPALVCWQTQEALTWALGLDWYWGPTVVCIFVSIPVLMK